MQTTCGIWKDAAGSQGPKLRPLKGKIRSAIPRTIRCPELLHLKLPQPAPPAPISDPADQILRSAQGVDMKHKRMRGMPSINQKTRTN